MFPTRLTIALFVSIFLMDVGASFAFQQPRFDLGGPCSPTMNAEDRGIYREMAQARKSQSWDRLIELEKRFVRGGCAIEYRWQELANVFIEAGRQPEAIQVLEEMDSRGFDLSFSLNPPRVGDEHKELRKFMGTPAFLATSVGIKIEALKQISDARRARYREVVQRMPSNQKPPERYIAKGACPFECCRFGNWTALQDIDLIAAPDDHQVVGRAMKGSRVDALTGEVHLRPEPVLVLTNEGGLPRDSVAFALDYEGEGYRHVYTQGKVVSVFTSVADYCFRPSEACWAETLDSREERREPVWWVKIRLSNGVTGWTDKADRFDGKDGCS
ncbi:MAG TPA: hypothetical protein VKB79_26035 [Bryobacteraceae bacterium]|nr:hypothetical protein [Bryobacteraceae bacterium]